MDAGMAITGTSKETAEWGRNTVQNGILRNICQRIGLRDTGKQQRNRENYKKRLCGVLMTMAVNEREIPEIRVISKYLVIHLETVWKNIHHTAIPESIKSTWYAVVH
jgi:putative cell wall-binding protein